jgi:kynurenine 3-monooxygenase
MSTPCADVQRLHIVGAGLAGALLAVLLARRGLGVTLYDRRPDPRSGVVERGRSINLALAARGIAGLEAAGVLDRVTPLLVPMRGRAVHEPGEATALLPYGQRPEEVIWSVSRAALNRVLVEAAASLPGVELRFGTACTGVDAEAGRLALRDEAGGRDVAVHAAAVIAADGAGSAVRRALQAAGLVEVVEDLLDHDYKELPMPAAHAAGLDPRALHIWPRGGFMLIALPNPDGSFTATLFLPRHGAAGFDALRDARAVRAFFEREFPGALPHLPQLEPAFAANPQGLLGTVRTTPWHAHGRVLLLGDAAHAIVPFHGQGMNCAFEDCVVLDALVGAGGAGGPDWPAVFGEFERRRRADTEAIAQMALENYAEMRDAVRDESFLRRKALGLALERRHPQRFIPRYSMVMFHARIPYAEALRRGAIQQQILERLDALGGEPPDAVDAEIIERLPPVAEDGRNA